MARRIFGLFIVLVGILLFLSNLDVIRFSHVSKYLWPSLLIIIGLVGMIERKRVDVIYLIITLIGISSILTTIGLIDKSILKILLLPIIIIIIGLKILTNTHIFKGSGSSSKSYTAIFGGVEEKNIDKNFERCEITSAFGSAQIDFRNIKLKENKGYIDVVCMFGGVELILPRGYKIIFNGTPIFGGMDDKLLENDPDSDKELIVNYTVIFGGIDIKS